MAKTLGSLCRSTTVEQVYNNNFEFPPALPTKLTPLDLCFEQKCGLYCRCLNEKSRMFAYCILSLQSHNSQVIFTEKQSSLFIVFIQIKQIIKYNRWQQRNLPIIHDVKSVKYKENEMFSHQLTCFPRLKKIVKTENKEHIQIALIILEDMHFLINITIYI